MLLGHQRSARGEGREKSGADWIACVCVCACACVCVICSLERCRPRAKYPLQDTRAFIGGERSHWSGLWFLSTLTLGYGDVSCELGRLVASRYARKYHIGSCVCIGISRERPTQLATKPSILASVETVTTRVILRCLHHRPRRASE